MKKTVARWIIFWLASLGILAYCFATRFEVFNISNWTSYLTVGNITALRQDVTVASVFLLIWNILLVEILTSKIKRINKVVLFIAVSIVAILIGLVIGIGYAITRIVLLMVLGTIVIQITPLVYHYLGGGSAE